MVGHLRTRTLTLLATPLWLACSFDTSVQFDGIGADPSADAGPGSTVDASPGSPDAPPTSEPDAAPTATAIGTLRSFPRTATLELDGQLDAAWQAQEFTTYAIADSQQFEALPDYDPDASLRMASLYDADHLYFFVEVTDDTLVNDSSAIYNDDSIEITLDGLGDRSGDFGQDDHWFVLGAESVYASLGTAQIEIEGVIIPTTLGYNIEFSVQRADVGPINATNLGFSIAINDDDGQGGTGVDAYGVWYVPATPACSDCCGNVSYPWCDTTRMGTLELVP